MTFAEAFWTVQLVLVVGAAIFSVDYDCGTAWEAITTLGASCPT